MRENEENLAIFTTILMAAFGTKNVHSVLVASVINRGNIITILSTQKKIFFFQLTRYLEKLIVESENLEERICVIRRILEILVVLQELNNFSGVLALTSAFKSASIHRILFDKNTGIFNDKIKSKLSSNLIKAYDVASSLYLNRFKIYWEKLRSINPPCVPYFGQYQTNLLLTDEGKFKKI